MNNTNKIKGSEEAASEELKRILDHVKQKESLLDELRDAGREYFEEDESVQRYFSDVIKKQKQFEVNL